MSDSCENRYGEDFIPGTTKIFVSPDNSSIDTSNTSRPLKKNSKGIILLPQPCDSPNDPLNWSYFRKGWHFIFLCFITALTAAISNDAGAAQDSLNETYGISYDAMNTGAGVLFLFIGWSCIVFAPASSLYGRRITYILCVLSGCLGSVWFAVSRKTADTIWSQAFVGISEACAEAQVQQSLSDIFFQHQLGSALTLYIMATSVGSFLGPLIAHIISEDQSFRWVGWWGAIICGATLILVIFTCEETVFDRSKYSVVYDGSQAINDTPEIEESKEEKNEPEVVKTTESFSFPQDNELQPSAESEKPWSYFQRMALITPASYLEGYGFKQYIRRFFLYFKVFTLPAVWLSGILWGLQDAYMTFFLTTQDTYFSEEPWNYSGKGVAIMNVATLIGAVIGCFVSGILSDKHVLWMAKRNSGILEPEYRLWLLFITLIISPLGLIMFGVGAARNWPWQAIYVGLGFIGFGWGSIGDTAMSYLMDSYPEIVIQGMVCVSIINNTLACIFTFVCSLWLDSAGTESTYIVLAVISFVSIAMIIPTLYWGKTWRKRTKDLYLLIVELSSSS
ncbi:MFS general substrate transporter [Suhomyces tanzawaensis NRRL Y-17324]|uniref:MFS general substrate transporter n=1 Tax=Suhomyces tanzawaensis NRRL Y-17324 TaxID=984487 RepID=A0A1E4SBL0_9ASCO|nr:MFS general substrate transporter [Suhomyces tanzawaensis NRRL Y-17324]ODV76920.1 MFS general substrate transporter [Suhomyces tanzawaensis NRRL Y-17324]